MTRSPLSQLALAERTRREVLHKSDLIPPLPDLVARLLSLLNKQDTEPAHLERLMQNDQVLVAKMLAMVNSPFYGMNRSIRTVKEAVMVLGFRGVRSLVLATSTAKFLQRDFSCYGHESRGLWLHAASVAAGAKALAKACRFGSNDAEQLFVGGLLHDIGKLLLVSHLGEHRQGLVEAPSLSEFERNSIGIDHAEAGGLVTAKWNLAPEIQELIRAHHGDGAGGVSDKAIAVVRLADAFAHERGTGYLPGMTPKSRVLLEDLQLLGLTSESWSALRDSLAVTMDDAVASFGSLGG
jgi:putative nucleotidyltransferase with HDIG domain